MSTTFKRGVGRLVTDRYDFKDHIDGYNFRHTAGSIDISPSVDIGGTLVTDVQEAFEAVESFMTLYSGVSQGFITVGDGYDTYANSETNPTSPYDNSIESLHLVLNDIFTNTSNPSHHRVRDGGIILIKAGTYIVTNTIEVPAGISIIGEGWGTKIINATSPSAPVFKIKQDLNRTSDVAIESSNPYVYSKQTTFYNFVISDNFVLPKFLGDFSYKSPQNTTESTPLISVEAGANFVCDKMTITGRVTYSGPTLNTLSSIAIGVDSTVPVNTGTLINVLNSQIDGFSQPFKFKTRSTTAGSGSVLSAENDYFSIKNNRIRAYGKLNGSTSLYDFKNNCFISSNTANINICDNYFYANDTGYISTMLYLADYQSGLSNNELPRINVANNNVLFDVAGTNPTKYKFIYTDYTTSNTYHFDVSNNVFNNTTYSVLDNKKSYITIGDGYTLGEFTGKDGIYNALQFASTAYNQESTVYLKVKPGTYESSTLSIPEDFHVIIEGESPLSTIIQNNSSSLLLLDHRSKLTLKNVTLRSSSNSIIENNNGILELENVVMDGVPLEIYDGASIDSWSKSFSSNYVCKVTDCNFINANDGYHLVLIEAGDGYSHDGFIFERCIFDNTENSVSNSCVLKIQQSFTYDSSTVLSGIYFNNCNFKLHTTTTNSNNFAYNSGIINIDLNTLSGGDTEVSGFEPLIKIKDIHLNDCTALAPNGVSSILHLIPTTTGDNWTNQHENPFIEISNIEIKGGEYLCDYGSRTFSPFNIILPSFHDTTIKISNSKFGFTKDIDCTNGGATDDISTWINPATSSTPITGDWGWMNLSAKNVYIDNIEFVNFCQLSDSGELFIKAPNVNINNVKIDYHNGAGGSSPNNRIKINGPGNVSGLYLKGVVSTETDDWALSSIISVIPQCEDPTLSWNTDGYLTIKDCNISGFIFDSSIETSVILKLEDNGFEDLSFTINNCNFKDFSSSGILYNGDSDSNSKKIKELIVSNCKILSAGANSVGINVGCGLTGTLSFDKVLISNNIITAGDYAIFIFSPKWNNTSYVTITGNSCRSISLSGQYTIYIRDYTESSLAKVNGQIMGNDCGGGGIALYSQSIVSSGDYTVAQLPIRGCETGYSSATTRRFTNGSPMIHNTAILKLLN